MHWSGDSRRSLIAALRRAMLFSVGSALILEEKADEFIKQAIERGQAVQDEGKHLVQEMRSGRKRRKPERIDALEVRINNAFERLNVPTRQDLGELNRRITDLAQRIDELRSGT